MYVKYSNIIYIKVFYLFSKILYLLYFFKNKYFCYSKQFGAYKVPLK